jgi:catechol 2,3-dioxygenase-like lactoylglutathione lyase family enzyme
MLRRLRSALLVAFLGALASLAAAAQKVREVADVGMTVSDLDRSVAFFSTVLSFEKVAEEERAGEDVERLQGVFGARIRVARLRLGREVLELTQYLAPEGRPFPPDTRSNDRWFQHVAIVVRDMDLAYRRLREHRVRHASTGPQRLPDWNEAAGGIEAFYFRDPDGHFLEIIRFPPGKGDPRWQGPGDGLFLGIDHTAIVVEDTERSLAFYRDLLGFRVAGASENYGTEQEHLNNVFGARLRITALRAGSGPGIEFLEYLAPRDGRPAPPDLRSNDLAHWQTTLNVEALDALAPLLRERRASFVSPGLVRSSSGASLLLVRDPDGHALALRQE